MQRPCRDERCGRCALDKARRRDGAMLSMVRRGYGRMCAEGLFGLRFMCGACGRYCWLGVCALLCMFGVGLRAVLRAWRLRIVLRVRRWFACCLAGLALAHYFACSELDYVRYCGLGARVLLRMFDVGLRAVLLAWRLRIASHVRRWLACIRRSVHPVRLCASQRSLAEYCVLPCT